MTRRIPVAAPIFRGNETAYVMDCLQSTWVSSNGSYIDRFEAGFAQFSAARHAISCVNGTAALHLALLALGVCPGDEVLVPTLTFVATANAVRYCNAEPVFVDSRTDTWNIDHDRLEDAITPRTRGIIAVHLYGHPADMDAIQAVARRHGLFVIEDAAEAHGATYKGRRVGSIGDAATFSFYGNKVLTAGEGGMVTTSDDALAERVRRLKGQGLDPARRYWFPIIGYNYRMTNVAAAIGLAQLEQADWHLGRRAEVAAWYAEMLKGLGVATWQCEQPWASHIRWMFTVLINADERSRDGVMAQLLDEGIETRPAFVPLHQLPPYQSAERGGPFPVAEDIGSRGISLPTWAGLTREDVSWICDRLVHALQG